MTTVLAVYDSSGCIGRCDDRCHSARIEGCSCICQGRNHGVGGQQAMANTREMVEGWLEAYKIEHPFTEIEVPALYTATTRTAIKVARTINTQAGYNRVMDVRRVKRGKQSVWEVDMKPYSGVVLFGDMMTVQYDNLKAVQAGAYQQIFQAEVA